MAKKATADPPKPITINLKVDGSLNDVRKSLNATWPGVIKAGLASLQGAPIQTTFDPAVEESLKLSVKHLTEAWNIIKRSK